MKSSRSPRAQLSFGLREQSQSRVAPTAAGKELARGKLGLPGFLGVQQAQRVDDDGRAPWNITAAFIFSPSKVAGTSRATVLRLIHGFEIIVALVRRLKPTANGR